jgi:hypothetical protein
MGSNYNASELILWTVVYEGNIAIRGEPLDNIREQDRPHDPPSYAARGTFLGQGPVGRTPSKISDSIPRLTPGIYSSLG